MFSKNIPAWRKEQYDAERTYARQILNAPKGSSERREAYVRAYSDVIGNIIEKNLPGGGESHSTELTVSLIAGLLPGAGSVLDIGCGSGGLITELCKRGYDAYGIDASEDSIVRAKQKLALMNAAPERASLDECSTYAPGRTFDCVVMDNVIEHIAPDEVQDLLAHCKRLLAPGGSLLIITPHRYSGPHDISRLFLPHGALPQGFHLKEYTCTELAREIMRAHFKTVAGYTLHPKLLRFIAKRLTPSLLSLRKALWCERWFARFPFSLFLKIHRTVSRAFVAFLFPTVLVGRTYESTDA